MNPLTEIVNRFPSRCAESGRHLLKGWIVYHDPIAKKAYHKDSEMVRKWKEAQQNSESGQTVVHDLPTGLGKTGAMNDFIQDPGITDEDNWGSQLF